MNRRELLKGLCAAPFAGLATSVPFRPNPAQSRYMDGNRVWYGPSPVPLPKHKWRDYSDGPKVKSFSTLNRCVDFPHRIRACHVSFHNEHGIQIEEIK